MPVNPEDKYYVWYPGGSLRGKGNSMGYRRTKKKAIALANSVSDPYVIISDVETGATVWEKHKQ